MAKTKIIVDYDDQTGQLNVGAPMANQTQKDVSVQILVTAIQVIVKFKPSPVILPATIVPPTANGNGMAN